MKKQLKALYESPLNMVIDEVFVNTPLCASVEDGFVTENFEDDGIF